MNSFITLKLKKKLDGIFYRDVYILDADGQYLKVICSTIVLLLLGKKNTYILNHKNEKILKNFNIDTGAFIYIKNINKILNLKKLDRQFIFSHSGYAGGSKKKNKLLLFQKQPLKVLKKMISGMLPKNKTRDKRLKRIMLYA